MLEKDNLVGLLEILNFKMVSALDGQGKETWFTQGQWIIITKNDFYNYSLGLGATSYEYRDGTGFLSSNLPEIITLLHQKFKNEIRDYQISSLLDQ